MVDYCEGGTTPRTAIGSGSNPSRTGNLGKRVGAIDICCPRLHPIYPNAADRAGVITDIAHHPKQQVFLCRILGLTALNSLLQYVN